MRYNERPTPSAALGGIVAKRDGILVALTDTGQLAGLRPDDPWPQFAEWVADHTTWFWHRLADGQQERVSPTAVDTLVMPVHGHALAPYPETPHV